MIRKETIRKYQPIIEQARWTLKSVYAWLKDTCFIAMG
tara:strand:+ start:1153 stop:1266 length:114 start_codon:yes stop_codon:yes gene_type:complete